ncbi:hypothetical protein [Anaerosinus massiliensis]|uniref:hypothetical protein n=1 Tax=Massilibacillus massiliensis TaxID=1806837 RepID=UPI000DA636C9|nr:hypothetical protein [Massilibacillus massiliensis]
MQDDILIIKKDPFTTEIYPKPLKVTTELHSQVTAIATETNQPIHKVACMLIKFALDHVEIKD